MFTVYALYSERYDKIYIGMTSDLEMRLYAHNNLPKGWTRSFRPWKVIYNEEFANKSDALKREKELKTAKGRSFVRSKI
jgi:putative endonuclease